MFYFLFSTFRLRMMLGGASASLFFWRESLFCRRWTDALPGSSRRVSHLGAEIALPAAATRSCWDGASPTWVQRGNLGLGDLQSIFFFLFFSPPLPSCAGPGVALPEPTAHPACLSRRGGARVRAVAPNAGISPFSIVRGKKNTWGKDGICPTAPGGEKSHPRPLFTK